MLYNYSRGIFIVLLMVTHVNAMFIFHEKQLQTKIAEHQQYQRSCSLWAACCASSLALPIFILPIYMEKTIGLTFDQAFASSCCMAGSYLGYVVWRGIDDCKRLFLNCCAKELLISQHVDFPCLQQEMRKTIKRKYGVSIDDHLHNTLIDNYASSGRSLVRYKVVDGDKVPDEGQSQASTYEKKRNEQLERFFDLAVVNAITFDKNGKKKFYDARCIKRTRNTDKTTGIRKLYGSDWPIQFCLNGPTPQERKRFEKHYDFEKEKKLLGKKKSD